MPVLPSYRNQSIDLLCKSMNWFLYDGNILLNGLRNLPPRLSTIVALLVLNSFKILKIDTELTCSNLSCFSFTKFNSLSFRVRKFLNKITCKIRQMRFKKVCDCPGRKCQLFLRREAYA